MFADFIWMICHRLMIQCRLVPRVPVSKSQEAKYMFSGIERYKPFNGKISGVNVCACVCVRIANFSENGNNMEVVVLKMTCEEFQREYGI
ncbi:predicted protein [Sclerotinia sclerotiorum 1980 UF-70]|uniref:Uncharacterized protein n=1 Tax=Sclerotinia sclerotiorum (strain ATCC 18683 / 1980 / Ss-1) TaxID=665079 RepID=A7EI08_SCLS1|nr:predicted protein [Sclerotinia sclerotiorum 1980 UF-70]EDO02474.1 predicted protein [Sclerotinia sclerotiorum 1980 UF-70]